MIRAGLACLAFWSAAGLAAERVLSIESPKNVGNAPFVRIDGNEKKPTFDPSQ